MLSLPLTPLGRDASAVELAFNQRANSLSLQANHPRAWRRLHRVYSIMIRRSQGLPLRLFVELGSSRCPPHVVQYHLRPSDDSRS